MRSEIKLGIIGCGKAAELIYLPILLEFESVKVAAVADPIKERRDFISSQLKNCKAYETLCQEILNEIDAVIVLTAPNSHIPLASELLNHKKYVLVEKPLSLNLDGTKELLKMENTAHPKLFMGFNHRYWYPINKLKHKLQDSGDSVSSSEIVFTSDYSKWNPVSSKSNALEDLGPHVFDLIRYIFNDELISISSKNNLKNDFSLIVKTAKGIFVKCKVAYSEQSIRTIKVTMQKNKYLIKSGSERISPLNYIIRNVVDFKDRVMRIITRKKSSLNSSYKAQLEEFLSSDLSARKKLASLSDGIINVKAIIAARKSIMENGREVFLNEIK